MHPSAPGMQGARFRRRGRGPLAVTVASASLVAAALAGCGGDDDPPAAATSSSSRDESTGATSPFPSSDETRPPTTRPSTGSGVDPGAGDGAPADGEVSGAALLDPDGVTVGTVMFEVIEGTTRVTVEITDGGEPNAFHGLVVHANDDPSNGEGCQADPDAPAGTWFVSADGHLTDDTDEGARHQGDLPNVWVMGDGTATSQILTDRLVPSEIVGTAVVLHALPNNVGNIPLGDGPGQYTPNSERSQMVTETTGNTGARIACGVIEAGGGAAGSPVR
jgi:Cu-Zn family superoxide dismutase